MVYIVTDNQIPWWLNTSYPRVKVIDHKEIFEKEEYLPIFNSNGIDASLHNIPGVAPCFLYLNDDVLVGHPIQITDFYDPKTGVQRMFPSLWVAPQTDKMKSNLWHAAVGYSDKLIDAAFGSGTPHHYAAHGCHFFQLHILTEMANRWPEEYDNTKKHPFRTATDVTIPFLHQNYALHAYNAKTTSDGLVNYGILTTDIPANHKIYDKVAKKDRHCVCLQDGFGDEDTPEVLAAVNDLEHFLETQYPGKSHFEKSYFEKSHHEKKNSFTTAASKHVGPKPPISAQVDFDDYSPLGVFGVVLWVSIFVFVFLARARLNGYMPIIPTATSSETKEV